MTGSTTLGQSWLGSNGNEGVLHTPQIFRTGASPIDTIQFYIQDTLFDWILLLHSVYSKPSPQGGFNYVLDEENVCKYKVQT